MCLSTTWPTMLASESFMGLSFAWLVWGSSMSIAPNNILCNVFISVFMCVSVVIKTVS